MSPADPPLDPVVRPPSPPDPALDPADPPLDPVDRPPDQVDLPSRA